MADTTTTSASSRNEKIVEIKKALRQRDEVRTAGDFSRADTLRDKLVKKYAIQIIDQPNGPSGFKFLDGSSNKLDNSAPIPVDASSGKKRSREEGSASASAEPSPGKKNRTGQETAPLKAEKPKKGAAAAKPSAEQSRNSALMASLVNTSSSSKTVQGVLIEELAAGQGAQARPGRRIRVHYVGKLKSNGKIFDSSTKKPFTFRLGAGEVIRGWDIGCDGMLVGGKRRLTIPPEKAYGKAGAPPSIPGNATLVFDVTLLDVM
eukprot:gene2215-2419_t